MSNIKKWEKKIDHWIEVDLDLCNGSGECAEICPIGIYEVENGKAKIDYLEDCIKCQECKGVCPNNAIVGHWAWK